MRRKLFFFTVFLIICLALLDAAGLPLMPGELTREDLMEKREINARVLRVEAREDGGFRAEVGILDEGRLRGRKVLLTCYDAMEDEGPEKLIGCMISCKVELQFAQERRNPGCFNYRRHLRSEGIEAVGVPESFRIEKEAEGLLNITKRELIKKKAAFIASLPKESRGIVGGILFGDVTFLSEEIYEEFQVSGTAHVLAVSGLHIGIICAAVQKISGKGHRKRTALITAAVLWIFGTLAMWSPSVTRACIMVLMKVYADLRDLRYDLLTAAGVVILGMIAVNPYIIFNAGFQMSFLAVCAIAFFMPHIPRKIPDSLGIVLAANFGLAPYQMFQFNMFSAAAVTANIPVIYLVGILLPAVAADFALFCIGVEIGPVRVVAQALAELTVGVNRAASAGGRGACDVISPPFWIVAAFYLLAFFISSETFAIWRIRRKRRLIAWVLAGIAVLSLLMGTLCHEAVGEDDVVFVDVGQGDCVHIRSGEKNILIDGGGSINYNVGKKVLKPYLLKNGERRIDLGLVTHLHTDHFKGMEELRDEGMVDSLRSGMTAGKIFKISDNVTIRTLWPLSLEGDEKQDENENCSVFMIYYGKHRILVTGDLDAQGEAKMVELYGRQGLKADILKAGHHGSKYSTCDGFLEAVNPKYCIFQVGRNNYGHPDAKIIEKCREKCIIVFRNDINGAIGFSFNGGKTVCHTMLSS